MVVVGIHACRCWGGCGGAANDVGKLNHAARPIRAGRELGKVEKVAERTGTNRVPLTCNLDNQLCGKVSREITVIQNVLRNPRQHTSYATVCTFHLLRIVGML